MCVSVKLFQSSNIDAVVAAKVLASIGCDEVGSQSY